MGGQQLLQQLRIGMEGEAPVPDQPLFLLLLHEVPDAVFIIFFIIVPLEGVEQIEIEIPGAGPLQAGIELLLRAGLIMALQPCAEFGT